jgi:hypothetical protein
MLAQDRKKRKESGAPTSGYKPRASNPALTQAKADAEENGNGAE